MGIVIVLVGIACALYIISSIYKFIMSAKNSKLLSDLRKKGAAK